MIKANQQYFELIENYRECFDEELFASRCSDILGEYDFVAGDFGYDQLRLEGFYEDSSKKTEVSERLSTIQDYILEYRNFGCPYFIMGHTNENERLELTSVDEIEDKLHDMKIKPAIQATQSTEKENNK